MVGLGTLDWLGLAVPYATFFAMLVAYYVWEGRRERRLRRRYEREREHGR